jgi:predicted alpha/beta superfamily hydrolase
MRLVFKIIGLLIFAALPAPAFSQATGPLTFLPALAGDYFPLDSQALGRRMHVFVRLPERYAEEPDKTYPVVYLLDGDSLFPMLAPQHLFLNYDEGLPDAVIVGIAYGGFAPGVNMRHVDFRPVLDDGSPGGSAKFLQFLETELLPRVEGQWRANPDRRVLFGQSRGGSFAIYAAYERPRLFHGFVASNPGREADTRLLYGMNGPQPPGNGEGWLIVTSGSRDRDYLRGTALQWEREIAGRTGLQWQTAFIDISGGTHAASAPFAYRAAMLRIFENMLSVPGQ